MLFSNTVKNILYPVAFWTDVLQKPLGWKSRFVVVTAESDLPVSLCLSLPPPPCIFSSCDPFVEQTDSNFCHHRSTVIFGPVSFCPSTIPTDQLTTAINVSLTAGNWIQDKFFAFLLWFSFFGQHQKNCHVEAELGLSLVLLERKDEREEEVLPLGTSLSTAGCSEDVVRF